MDKTEALKNNIFDVSIYTDRRNTLKTQIGSGIILLIGNEESGINYADNWYPFRQDSTFLYYTGLNKPHLTVIIDIDEEKEILFGNDPTVDEIIWTGPIPSIEDLSGLSGIKEFHPYDKIDFYLKKVKGRKVHFLPPYRPEHTLKLQSWLNLSPEEVEKNKSIPLIKAVVVQRSRKTEEEIGLIEKAVKITGFMHMEAMLAVNPGMKEFELMSRVHQKALEFGGRLAFPVILSRDGQILHNHSHENTIEEGDMVLCDAGAEIPEGYSGDMTRTFPVGERFTHIQKIMYTIVLEAQQAAIEALKPGVLFKEIHKIACLKLMEGLKEVGLMKGPENDAYETGAHTIFFQCGLGHMMGLDVHDMENLGEEYVGYTESLTKSKEFGLKSLRLGRALEPGFVVTIEPGIYIIPELIDMWEGKGKHKDFVNYQELQKFRDFGGIRIEDEDGARLLGDPIPKKPEEIENKRRHAYTQ